MRVNDNTPLTAHRTPCRSSPVRPRRVTPAMRQYLDAKRQYRDAIVFFRMGDFYEMFYEDALVAARALELTLTSRSKDAGGNGIPMCGVPVPRGRRLPRAARARRASASPSASRSRIREGQGPGQARGRPRRLARHAHRRQLSRGARAGVPDGDRAARDGTPAERTLGVALLDLSTGEFSAAEYRGADGLQALADEIAVLRPREIVVPRRQSTRRRCCPRSPRLRIAGRRPLDGVDVRARARAARRCSISCRRTASKASASRAGRPPSRPPAGSSATCATRRRPTSRTCARSPTARAADCLIIDPVTLKHLEVVDRQRRRPRGIAAPRDRPHGHVDGRAAAARLAAAPLVALERIRDRLDAVEELAFRTTERGKFRDDAEGRPRPRAARRARARSAPPDRATWWRCASRSRPIPRVRSCSSDVQAPLLRSLVAELDDLRRRPRRASSARSSTSRRRSPATAASRATASTPELDELRRISRSGRQVIAEMEERERARTGIGSLKVRFNRVFGYYIEISKSNLHARARPTTSASRRSPAASASPRRR